jgi:hypothetical protein
MAEPFRKSLRVTVFAFLIVLLLIVIALLLSADYCCLIERFDSYISELDLVTVAGKTYPAFFP